MDTKEAFLFADLLIGARTMTVPDIDIGMSTSQGGSAFQRLNEYNASVKKIRGDAYNCNLGDPLPWGDHVLYHMGKFQFRTCPEVNYYRFYACKFAQEDSFHNYVTINDEEYDLPPTTFQGLSKADIAILRATRHVLLNVKPEKNGLNENHSISVIHFFVKNVVAGTDKVVTGDNELFSTWGVGTTRVRAYSFDPALITAAYWLLEALKDADESLPSKLKIATCYILYLEAQIGVLNVSELSKNTELLAEIIYYTKMMSRATTANNVVKQLPDGFLCERDRTSVYILPDISGPIYERYREVLNGASKYCKTSAHGLTNGRKLQSSEEENCELVPALERPEQPHESSETNASDDINLESSHETEPKINWLWTRSRRGNDIEREWNVDANDVMEEIEIAHIPEGEDFTVDAIRELLYNKETYEDIAGRRHIEAPNGEIIGVKEFKFDGCDKEENAPSFSLVGFSLRHVLVHIMVELSRNAEITMEWAYAVADCLSIIGSPVKVSASAVGTSLNAGQLLQCYQHFVRPALQKALESVHCDEHDIQGDMSGFGAYVDDKMDAIATAYREHSKSRIPLLHQAVDCAKMEKYAGPDVDFKFYIVKELQYVNYCLTYAPEKKLSVKLGSAQVIFSINRRGQIRKTDIASTVQRLLPKEIAIGPSFAQAKWILPDRTDWGTNIADTILSGAYSREAALWLYNNIIVGRVPINSQSACTSGIPKIALKENGYVLSRGLTPNLLNEIPHIFSPTSQAIYMTPLPTGNVFELSYIPNRGTVQLSELPELKEDVLHMKHVSVQYFVKAA